MAFGQQAAEGFRNAETVIANSVILVGPHESLLAYFPSVGLGNLVASISSAQFLDNSGNMVLDGVYEYYNSAGTYIATGLNQGANGLVIQTASSPAGPYTTQGYMTWSGVSGSITVGGVSGTTIPSNLFATAALNVTNLLTANGGISTTSVGASGSGTFGGIGQFTGLLTLLAGANVSGAPLTVADGLIVDNLAAPAGTAAAATEYATSGHLKYVDSSGNPLSTGRVTAYAAGQTINTTGFTAITGLTVPVVSGVKYRFRLLIHLFVNQAAGQWGIELTGPTTSALNYGFKFTAAAGTGGLNVNETAFSVSLQGPATSANSAYWAEVEGTLTPSANGNLAVSGNTSVAADTWTLYSASYLDLYPVT